MDEEVHLKPQSVMEEELGPELEEIIRSQKSLQNLSPVSSRRSSERWDPPLDLRVIRPCAVDLRELWKLTGQPTPPGIAASLGPRRPILLNHLVTPFAADGNPPGRVWGLGYEFVAHGIEASTVSVVPDNEVMKIAEVGQKVDLGLELGGRVGIPGEALKQMELGPTVSLSGASIRAATDQRFQFTVEMNITLRKVLGAGVGIGGAQWKLYRQNEPLDQPHTLLQTILVPEKATSIRCTVKTWAKQAGLFGTRWGARFWQYPDQEFKISLVGS
ncbi:MAG: hypothetical protein Q8M07_02580 [Prosthecobacter sp.]|nr:hypothetical protein [Prosthecobacter sp.]